MDTRELQAKVRALVGPNRFVSVMHQVFGVNQNNLYDYYTISASSPIAGKKFVSVECRDDCKGPALAYDLFAARWLAALEPDHDCADCSECDSRCSDLRQPDRHNEDGEDDCRGDAMRDRMIDDRITGDDK